MFVLLILCCEYFKRLCYVTLGGLESVRKVEALVGLSTEYAG